MRNSIISSLVIIVSVLSLSACVMTPERAVGMSTMELCVGYLSLPTMNINQGTRAQELARRGEDCSAYTGAAEARRESDREFDRKLENLQHSLNPHFPSELDI